MVLSAFVCIRKEIKEMVSSNFFKNGGDDDVLGGACPFCTESVEVLG